MRVFWEEMPSKGGGSSYLNCATDGGNSLQKTGTEGLGT
jgi:hypothetical protein